MCQPGAAVPTQQPRWLLLFSFLPIQREKNSLGMNGCGKGVVETAACCPSLAPAPCCALGLEHWLGHEGVDGKPCCQAAYPLDSWSQSLGCRRGQASLTDRKGRARELETSLTPSVCTSLTGSIWWPGLPVPGHSWRVGLSFGLGCLRSGGWEPVALEGQVMVVQWAGPCRWEGCRPASAWSVPEHPADPGAGVRYTPV